MGASPGQDCDTRTSWLGRISGQASPGQGGLRPGAGHTYPLPTDSAYSWAVGEEPNFQGLQRQVGAQLQDLATLPTELRHLLLSAVQELLQDPRALQELKDTVRGP